MDCPTAKNRKLKKQSNRKALNISGDLPLPFSPTLLYVLFLWYNGSSDWIIPVTQKKLSRVEIKRNVSHEPISARVSWLFAKTILTMRKTKNFSNWNSCRPEMLSFILIFCKTLKRILVLPDNYNYSEKLHQFGSYFYEPFKDSNCIILWENKFKILYYDFFGLILHSENGGCSSVG